MTDYKKLYEQSQKENKDLKDQLEDFTDIAKMYDGEEACDLNDYIGKLVGENVELENKVIDLEVVFDENKRLKERNEALEFGNEMWTAESRFLNMDSAKSQPEEFNDFLKEEYDETTYKKMFEEFELKELLEVSDEESEEESEED